MRRPPRVTQPSRRELVAAILGAPLFAAPASAAPTAPVAIAKCPSYDLDQVELLNGMFEQLGGLSGIVRNKTVTVKVNLTGSPALKLQGRPLGVTHYTHPKQIAALAHLLDRAGARRIRFVESAWATAGPLEEYMLDSGWNVRQLKAVSTKVSFENTNGLGTQKKYVKFAVPGGGEIFPSYHLNQIYDETDVFVSMAKLKNHATCGVTLSMKNIFGITPASIYGDDAGRDNPNEAPTKGRGEVCHAGKRNPSAIAAPERNPSSSRAAEFRMPRITAELVAARPIHIALIDGIETVTGGEGPWIGGLRHVKPGVMIVGTNPVTADTVATAVMGYQTRAAKGEGPFRKCDNTLLLAEALGIGTAELGRIEVRGAAVADVMFPFPV
ncbi:MAG: DUF362 domain-containing protein [Bryobacteraceae bacterium]